MKELSSTLRKLKSELGSFKEFINSYNDSLIYDKNKAEDKLVVNTNKASVSNNGKLVIQRVSDNIILSHAESLSLLVTRGLQTVFGQFYVFNIEVSETSKRAELKIMDTRTGDTFGNITDSKGGGIVSFVSFVIQLFFILKFNLSKIILLDERLSMVSKEYIPAVSEFLRSLCDELGADILFVTHNADFMEYADISYTIKPDFSMQGYSVLVEDK